MEKYKFFIQNTAILSVGTLLSKAIVFFMVRFYTDRLTPAQYGTADLLTTTISLLVPLISLGIADGIFRFIPTNPEDKQSIFSIGIYTTTVVAVLFAVLLPILHEIDAFQGYLGMLVFMTMASCYHSLCAQYVRGIGHTVLYAVQGLWNTALVVGLNLVFLTVLDLGITGYVLSVALADLACTLILWNKEHLGSLLTRHPKRKLFRSMLQYSVPLIPTSIFWWITSVSDRYMVNGILGSHANGIYTVANKLPTMITLVSYMIMEVWKYSAISEEESSEEEKVSFYSHIWLAFFSMLFGIGSLLIAFSKVEIHLLAASNYSAAWQYMPVLCMAMLFCSFDSFLGSVYMAKKKSGMSFWTSLVGAATNIALNAWWIPSRFGVQGAALATLCSYGVVFLLRAKSARRWIPFRLYKGKLLANTAIITVQSVFMVAEWTGWQWVQAGAILLLWLVNRKQILKILNVLGVRIRKRT